MKLETKKIYLKNINLRDKTFLLSYGYDINPIKQSIEQVGLINPPIVRKRSDGTCQIICGHKRVHALRELTVSTVICFMLSSKTSDEECFLLSLLDNVSHREFNPIEKSMAINKLQNYYTEEKIVQDFLSVLKLQPHITQLKLYKPLCKLAREIRNALIEGKISEHTAVQLSQMDCESRSALGKLLIVFKLSVSKQAEILEYVTEIAVRENISVDKVVSTKKIKSILENEKLNQPQKGEAIRKYLRGLRYPQLTAKEKEFNHNLKQLKLPPGTQLKATPFFEGNHYHLSLNFKDMNGLKRRLQELESLLNNRSLLNIIEG